MRHSQSQQTRYRFAGASSFQIQVDLPPTQYQVEHPQKDDKPTRHETFSESTEGSGSVHAGTGSGEQEGGDAAEGGGGAEGSREPSAPPPPSAASPPSCSPDPVPAWTEPEPSVDSENVSWRVGLSSFCGCSTWYCVGGRSTWI